jgi:hypothetical protein
MCGFWEGRPPCRPNLPLRSSSAVRAEADPPLSVASIWCSTKSPQKSTPSEWAGFRKSLMNRLDLAHVCIATVLSR